MRRLTRPTHRPRHAATERSSRSKPVRPLHNERTHFRLAGRQVKGVIRNNFNRSPPHAPRLFASARPGSAVQPAGLRPVVRLVLLALEPRKRGFAGGADRQTGHHGAGRRGGNLERRQHAPHDRHPHRGLLRNRGRDLLGPEHRSRPRPTSGEPVRRRSGGNSAQAVLRDRRSAPEAGALRRRDRGDSRATRPVPPAIPRVSSSWPRSGRGISAIGRGRRSRSSRSSPTRNWR
jgi:hypothetical protein